MKNILLMLFMGFLTVSYAQDKKVEIIKVKTSAICGECKERIENKLNYTKGVVFAELDLESNIVTIKYKTKQISKKEVKTVLTDLGYHADELERNADGFSKLPGCCQDKDAKCSKK